MFGLKERFVYTSWKNFVRDADRTTQQPYKDDIRRIAQDLTGCEPEVCLAVKVPPVLSESADEDDSEIDAFLSSHGFEYVDATEKESSQRSSYLHEEEDFAGLVVIPSQNNIFTAIFRHTPNFPGI